MYKKGVRADMDRVDEDNRLRDIHDAQQRDVEAANGTTTDPEGGIQSPPPAYGGASQPGRLPTTFKYTPPAYTAY
jgi:hypothetical protein